MAFLRTADDSYLSPMLGPVSLPSCATKKEITVRRAIGFLPPVAAGKPGVVDSLHSARTLTPMNLARIRASRQAGTWREWPEDLRVACHKAKTGRTYPSVYGRMSWDRPAP